MGGLGVALCEPAREAIRLLRRDRGAMGGSHARKWVKRRLTADRCWRNGEDRVKGPPEHQGVGPARIQQVY